MFSRMRIMTNDYDLILRVREELPMLQPMVENAFDIALGDIDVLPLTEYEKREKRELGISSLWADALAGMRTIYANKIHTQEYYRQVHRQVAHLTLHELNHIVMIRLSGASSLDEYFKSTELWAMDHYLPYNLGEGFAEWMTICIADRHGIPYQHNNNYNHHITGMERWAASRKLSRPSTIARRLAEYMRKPTGG